jgi:hypothetical protein
MGMKAKTGEFSRGTVKRASMVPPREIPPWAGCERNVEDDFAGKSVRPRENSPVFAFSAIRRKAVTCPEMVQDMFLRHIFI